VQKRARKASTDKQWHSVGDLRRMLRRLAIVLTAVVTLGGRFLFVRTELDCSPSGAAATLTSKID
jgi:hypothetical protein